MLSRLTKFLSAVSLGLALLGTARSQCTVLTNPPTGCPNATAPKCSGAPRIGTTLTVSRSCAPGRISLILIGTPPYFQLPLPPSITCQRGCSVGFLPIDFIVSPTGQLVLPIPNSRQLIGLEIGLHFMCLDAIQPCLGAISPVLQVKFQ